MIFTAEQLAAFASVGAIPTDEGGTYGVTYTKDGQRHTMSIERLDHGIDSDLDKLNAEMMVLRVVVGSP
jgi:hypothetical protein